MLGGITIDKRALGLDVRSRRARMRQIAHAIVAAWKAEARQQLGTTLRPYLASIQISEVSDSRAAVTLAGEKADPKVAQTARIAEFGLGPGGIGTYGEYDVRQFLLQANTRRLRIGPSGPYVDVPFRRTADQIKTLGGSVALRVAQALGPSWENGQRLGGGAEDTRMPDNLAPKIAPHHVADPLTGMVRSVSTYSRKDGEVVTQTSGWRMWRRASWSGQPWRSKGVRPRRLADEVAKRLGDVIAEALG